MEDTLPSVLMAGLEAGSHFDDAPEGMVFHADCGEMVLEMLRIMDFDLLLMGRQLQGLNAWETAKRLRQRSNPPRWMYVSPYLTRREEILARSLGAVGVLNAVPEWTELAAIAAAAMQRQEVNRSPASLARS